MGASVHRARWDSYRLVLAIVACAQVIAALALLSLAIGGYGLIRRLSTAESIDRPVAGKQVCINGEVSMILPPTVSRDTKKFETEYFERRKGLHPVWFEAEFTHVEKRGKSSRTLLDERLRLEYKFSVKTDWGLIFVDDTYPDFYSNREETRYDADLLRAFSPPSTQFKVTYFAAPYVYVIGDTALAPDGTLVISGKPDRPVIISQLSDKQLIHGTGLGIAACVLALGYFLFSVFFPWKSPLRKKFEWMPNDFFVLDMAGGSERIAMGLIIAAPFALMFIAGIFQVECPHRHESVSFFAACFFVYAMLVHISRSIEFFYLADRRDGYLYSIHRGLISTERVRLAPLNRLKLEVIEVWRGKNRFHLLAASAPGLAQVELTSGFVFEDAARQVETGFVAFIAGVPASAENAARPEIFDRE